MSIWQIIILSLFVCSVIILACYYYAWNFLFRKNKMPRKTKVIGITGTIASGKSLVGKLLGDLKIPVIDTDHIAHEVLRKDEVKELLRAKFGNIIFDSHNEINRKELGNIVFANEQARKELESIVHPETMKECRRRIAQLQEHSLVAVLVPLLFEANLQNEYDEIWTVIASEAVLRERLRKRDNLSDVEIDKRLQAQFPQATKVSLSDQIIDNSGSIEETKVLVIEALNRSKTN